MVSVSIFYPSKPVQESLLRRNRPLPNRSRGSTTSSRVQTFQELAEYSSSTKQAACTMETTSITVSTTIFQPGVSNVRACEPEPRAPSREPIFASHCFFSYLFIYLFIYFFGVLNLTLTFSSVNCALGRRNTSFRFSFVREIPRK